MVLTHNSVPPFHNNIIQMINKQIITNKSNLRIASEINFTTLSLTNRNNNNNNNNNHNNINGSRDFNLTPGTLPSSPTTSQISSNRTGFAASYSSPSLDDTSNMISIASLNVRGLASSVPKFDAIIDDLFNKDISIIGLQETHITEQSANILFKNRCAIWSKEFPYRAYWDYNPTDRYSGVGLIVKSFVSTYVQKITRHQGRFIALDLFLPARKLKIINIYNHQKINWLATRENNKNCGQTFTNFVIKQITDAKQAGFSVIILGDLNLSPSCFLEQQALGLRNPAHFKLIDFLFERNYIDQHSLDEQYNEYATYYSHGSPTSRIDLTWYPDDFIRNDFCFAQVWKLPCSYDLYPLDHNCVITYFTKGLFAAELPKHRRFQKQEWRWFFNVKMITQEEWAKFNEKAAQYLDKFENNQCRFPHRSSLNYDHKALNYQWQGFKTALIKAAHDTLPKKKISPYIYQDKSTSDELKHLQLQTSLLNQIYHTIYQFLYETNGSQIKAKQLQHLWTDKQPACRRSCLVEINSQYKNSVGHFDSLTVPYLLVGNTRE